MRRRSLLVLSLALATVLAGCWSGDDSEPAAKPAPTSATAASSVRYVDPDGRDTWPGTREKPWQSLDHALPAMMPGQVLYVHGGVYRETLVKLNVHTGTPRQRITVRAYPGERPVVQGVFWLQRPSYWTIDGIDVTWDDAIDPAPRHMVKVTGGVGWTWTNSEIWASRAAANMLITGYGKREPANWSFTANCVHNVRPPVRMHRSSNLTIGGMGPGAGPGTITRNKIFNAPGPQNVAFGSVQGGGPTNVDFTYNTVYGADVAIAFAGDAALVSVHRNILGGVTSKPLIRWNGATPAQDEVSQNLGLQADRFMRPAVDDLLAGPGNIINERIRFANSSTCGGFHTKAPAALPYGRYGVG